MTIELRRATEDDPDALVEVFLRCQHESYAHHQGWAEDGTTRSTEKFGELERPLTKEQHGWSSRD